MTAPAEAHSPGLKSGVRWSWAAMVLVPTGLTLVLHGRMLDGFFLGDDLEVIWRATAFDPSMPSLGYGANHWRPLMELTLRPTRGLAGLDPRAYHLGNVVLHLATAVMVGVSSMVLTTTIERRRVIASDRLAAVAAATLFAVLPSHGEAVAWIAGRSDVLMTLCALGALVAFSLGRHTLGTARNHGKVVLTLSMVLLGAALLSKESAVVVPLIATAIEVARDRTGDSRVGVVAALRRGLVSAAPLYAVTVIWFAVRTLVLGSVTGGFTISSNDLRVTTVAGNVGSLVVRSLLPAMPRWAWVVASAAVGGAVVWAVALSRSDGHRPGPRRGTGAEGAGDGRRVARTATIYAVCVALAALPVILLGVSVSTVAGERLTYLPSAFAVLAVARLWAEAWIRHRVLATIAMTAAVGAAAISTWFAVGQWATASEKSERLVRALAVLPKDRPALVAGATQRTDNGIPIALNAVGPAMVLLHGWSDPSLIADIYGPLPDPGTADAPIWLFDGRTVRLLDRD